jgi:hypothetical protein
LLKGIKSGKSDVSDPGDDGGVGQEYRLAEPDRKSGDESQSNESDVSDMGWKEMKEEDMAAM